MMLSVSRFDVSRETMRALRPSISVFEVLLEDLMD